MDLTLEADRPRAEEAPVAKPKKPDSGRERTEREPGAKRAAPAEFGSLALGVPYLSWAAATAYQYLGAPPDLRTWSSRIPVLLELKAPASSFAAEFPNWNLGTLIEVPSLFAEPPAGLESVTFCTASVAPAFFESAAARKLTEKWIKRIELGLPGLDLPQLPARRAPIRGRAAAAVVTAVMDDALPFVHERFRDAIGGTRAEYVWKQGAPGLVLSKAQIDAVLASHTHAGILDEDAVYRALGYEDPAAPGHNALLRRAAHGAHVMDLACGRDASREATPPIIGVQFPAGAIRDTSGAWLGPHIYLGLWFILYTADLIAADRQSGPLPVVANVSYGKYADSHDGQSLLEAAMDQLISQRNGLAPFSVVLPSGNSFLARCHAQLPLAPRQRRTLRWRVQPDDRTPSFLEIWPRSATAGGATPALEVSIKPPGAATAITVARGGSAEWPTVGPLLARVEYRTPGPQGPHRDVIHVSLAPTATLDATESVAPAGTWEVTLENMDTAATADVDAWIQRDDTPYGWPITGRQSRFDDPEYERFHPAGTYDRTKAAGSELADDNGPSYVKRAGSLNAIATGEHPVVIASFRKSDWTAAAYSSGGPIPLGQRTGFTPDAMAVGDDSPVCDGVLAAGTRSGSAVAMSGTSIAAPQIARWLATRMENGLPADRAAVHALAAPSDPPLPIVPVVRKGAGRVDVRPPRRIKRRDF